MKQVSGLARLQFTRVPYTHWSLCFLGDPVIELDIETQFQGRQMQSNVTSLISNQIRKAIRRKHTMPNYKLRYKPFFYKVIDDDADLSEVQLDGLLDINLVELSRLSYPPHVSYAFCTITLAPLAWVTARQHDDKSTVCVLDIEIHKAKNQQIGIVFKQLEQAVMVDAVIPNTPAMKAQLRKGDMLVSIEGKKIASMSSIAKIVKGLNRPVFVLRIERVIPGVIRNDVDSISLEDTDVTGSYEMINDLNISFSKTGDSVQIGNKTRQNSNEKLSTDSSRSNTPTSSPVKVREGCTVRQRGKSLSRNNSDSKSSANEDGVSAKPATAAKAEASDSEISATEIQYPMHTTIDSLVNSFISMNDLCQFKVDPISTFLNINVFGRWDDEVELLGYANIPLQNVISEYNDSTLAHFVRQFKLCPPDAPNLCVQRLGENSLADCLSLSDRIIRFRCSPASIRTYASATLCLPSRGIPRRAPRTRAANTRRSRRAQSNPPRCPKWPKL